MSKNVILLGIFMMLLVAPAAAASQDWPSPYASNANDGRVTDTFADFSEGLNSTISVTNGRQSQPLVYDLDGDNVNELIIYNEPLVTILDAELNVLNELNLGSLQGHITIYDDGVTTGIAGIFDDIFEVWSFDGATFNDEYTDDTTVKTCDVWQGVQCEDDKCYAICEDSSQTVTLFTFDVQSNMNSESDSIGEESASFAGLALYTFDNGNAEDSIASNDGTVNGATFNATGGPGTNTGFYDFDGVNDYISIPDSAALDVGTDFSLEAWIYVSPADIAGGDHTIISMGSGANVDWDFHTNGGNIRFNAEDSTGSRDEASIASGFVVNNWYHVVGSVTQTNITIWIDGAQVVTQAHAFAADFNPDTAIDIGSDAIGTIEFWNGAIDHVRILNGAVSDADVVTLYNAGSPLGTVSTMDISSDPAHYPTLIDNDFDGNSDMTFVCDYNKDGSYGICVVDTTLGAFDPDFDGAATTVPGVIDDLEKFAGSNYITNPIVTTVSGGGGYSIYVAWSDTGACSGVGGAPERPHMARYTSVGELTWQQDGTTSNGNFVFSCFSGPSTIIQPFTAVSPAGGKKICFARSGPTSFNPDQNIVACLNPADGTTYFVHREPTTLWNVNAKTGAAALNADNTGDYMLVSNKLFDPVPGGSWVNNNDLAGVGAGYYSIFGDLTGDGQPELISATTAKTQVITSSFDNSPPDIREDLTHAGYFGYVSNPCLGDSVTFNAREDSASTDYNYANDVVQDIERLVTSCGTGATLQYGDASSEEPTISCQYNSTGTYSVTIYLQDQANSDDLSQFNADPIIINVLDGTPGQTCGTIIGAVSPSAQGVSTVSAASTEIDNAVDTAMDSLFGSGTTLKLIIGLVIVLMIIIGVAQATGSAFAIMAGGLIGLVLVTFLGLVPVYIMVVGLVGMLLVIVLQITVFGKGGGA